MIKIRLMFKNEKEDIQDTDEFMSMEEWSKQMIKDGYELKKNCKVWEGTSEVVLIEEVEE